MLATSFLVLLFLEQARAQDAAPYGEVIRLEPQSGAVVRLEWTKEDDVVRSELLISGQRREQAEVVLTFRAWFADRVTSWTTEPTWVESATSVGVSVQIPSEAHWAEEQENFFTNLEIGVQCYNADRRLIGTHSGPGLKLLWSDDAFVLLEPAQAKELAPYGYVHEAPPGAEDLIAEAAAEGVRNVEFGPGI